MDAYVSVLPKIIEHLCILLKDRGYVPPILPKTFDEIAQKAIKNDQSIGECLTFTVNHIHTQKPLVVGFLDPLFDPLKNKEIMTSAYQIHGAIMDLEPNESALLVCFSKMSPDSKKEINKLKKRVQVICHTSLLFPMTSHVLYKSHVAMTEEEARKWEQDQRTLRKNLPQLKFADPVRIWFGWPKNTIIKIERGALRVVK
jgi:DNA-directed RNA polymerase subunit H (RpoH/RPB5)